MGQGDNPLRVINLNPTNISGLEPVRKWRFYDIIGPRGDEI